MSNQFPESLTEAMDAWVSAKELMANTERAYRLELERLHDWAIAKLKATRIHHLAAFEMTSFLVWVSGAYAANHAGQLPQRGSLQQTKRIVGAFLRDSAKARGLPMQQHWAVDGETFDGIAGTDSVDPVETVVRQLAVSGKILVEKGSGRDSSALRDQLMANLAFWCCATTSELSQLTLGHISVEIDQVMVGAGTARARQVSVPHHVVGLLKRYLAQTVPRKRSKAALLFAGTGSVKLSASTIRKCVKRAITLEGVEVSPRLLRSAFAALAHPLPLPAGRLAYRMGRREVKAPSLGLDLSQAALTQLTKSFQALAYVTS